jgi:chromate reductase, NAD(P)H dehydrogenase (quinone)
VIGASTGLFGAVWAQADLRKVLRHTGARVLDEDLPVPAADQAFAPGLRLAVPELQQRLEDLLAALVSEAEAPLVSAAPESVAEVFAERL